jgi:hypothetical protein
VTNKEMGSNENFVWCTGHIPPILRPTDFPHSLASIIDQLTELAK